jgi:hypothetical protein
MRVWVTENQEGTLAGMGSALLALSLEVWVPRERDVIAAMVRNGQLTEADAFEVSGILDLLIEKVTAGEITPHFAELVLRKLADDKCEAWRERVERKP